MPDTSFDYVNIFAGSYESDGKKMNTLLSEEVSQQDSGSGDVVEAKEKPATGGRQAQEKKCTLLLMMVRAKRQRKYWTFSKKDK